MPVIKALPSPEIIRGFRGVLDFYVWRGLNCVRKWPHIPPASRTAKSMASAALFGAIIQGYALLGGVLKNLFTLDATDQDRTARDLYISGVLGHLHEAGMVDFLDLLTQATAYLQTLTELVNALETVGTDELRTLPGFDGAHFQPLLVDASRRLQVRGQDQLLSFKEPLVDSKSELDPDAGTVQIRSDPVPAGQIWKITSACIYATSPTITKYAFGTVISAAARMHEWYDTPTDSQPYTWHGELWLKEGDMTLANYYACTAGDSLYFITYGHKMTLET